MINPNQYLKHEIKEQGTDLSFDFLATGRPNSQTIQQQKIKALTLIMLGFLRVVFSDPPIHISKRTYLISI